ncbi:hypothetical protein FRB96_007729 [Tulasnella sp. 330]|nr:hypothetical protein FRB96_007729 [Tulasnella sp. 330]
MPSSKPLPDHYRGHVNRAPIDPFIHTESSYYELLNAILATALFRCWHLILFFAVWATLVILITVHVHDLTFASTLLTVFGTVLGFVISYRTTASFERYNEGRRYWSSIVFGSRLLARTIWFNVPDDPPSAQLTAEEIAEKQLRTMIEKKSAINLIEAFGMSLKHYLRGEESIFYQDLYHLVKHLPVYALPAGRLHGGCTNKQQQPDLDDQAVERIHSRREAKLTFQSPRRRSSVDPMAFGGSPESHRSGTIDSRASRSSHPRMTRPSAAASPMSPIIQEGVVSFDDLEKGEGTLDNASALSASTKEGSEVCAQSPAIELRPGWNPPPYAIFDVFPFSLFVRRMAGRGYFKGKQAVRLKAREGIVKHNIPLELTLYLGSYVSILQQRKCLDVPTTNTLLTGVNTLLDSLTGLERILTTPVPFSYTFHLWTVTTIYVALLPFQLWVTLKYLTIPATAISAFIFYGFIVAGEEIENPFGYDKNDLDLDHFTDNIIRPELNALTSRPMPNISSWAFDTENTHLFFGHGRGEMGVTPDSWIQRGDDAVREVLAKADPSWT